MSTLAPSTSRFAYHTALLRLACSLSQPSSHARTALHPRRRKRRYWHKVAHLLAAMERFPRAAALVWVDDDVVITNHAGDDMFGAALRRSNSSVLVTRDPAAASSGGSVAAPQTATDTTHAPHHHPNPRHARPRRRVVGRVRGSSATSRHRHRPRTHHTTPHHTTPHHTSPPAPSTSTPTTPTTATRRRVALNTGVVIVRNDADAKGVLHELVRRATEAGRCAPRRCRCPSGRCTLPPLSQWCVPPPCRADGLVLAMSPQSAGCLHEQQAPQQHGQSGRPGERPWLASERP